MMFLAAKTPHARQPSRLSLWSIPLILQLLVSVTRASSGAGATEQAAYGGTQPVAIQDSSGGAVSFRYRVYRSVSNSVPPIYRVTAVKGRPGILDLFYTRTSEIPQFGIMVLGSYEGPDRNAYLPAAGPISFSNLGPHKLAAATDHFVFPFEVRDDAPTGTYAVSFRLVRSFSAPGLGGASLDVHSLFTARLEVVSSADDYHPLVEPVLADFPPEVTSGRVYTATVRLQNTGDGLSSNALAIDPSSSTGVVLYISNGYFSSVDPGAFDGYRAYADDRTANAADLAQQQHATALPSRVVESMRATSLAAEPHSPPRFRTPSRAAPEARSK